MRAETEFYSYVHLMVRQRRSLGVDADIADNTWHTMAIRAEDDRFTVSLDGVWVFTAYDKTLFDPGRTALWTASDSSTRFDSIAITPLPASEERY
jgi:hypothetical protein